jgi:hypothetical protein
MTPTEDIESKKVLAAVSEAFKDAYFSDRYINLKSRHWSSLRREELELEEPAEWFAWADKEDFQFLLPAAMAEVIQNREYESFEHTIQFYLFVHDPTIKRTYTHADPDRLNELKGISAKN